MKNYKYYKLYVDIFEFKNFFHFIKYLTLLSVSSCPFMGCGTNTFFCLFKLKRCRSPPLINFKKIEVDRRKYGKTFQKKKVKR